jgi:ADP-ribosylglycohydrolase
MAMAIYEILQQYQHIEQDPLARSFARRFRNDPERGYGAMAYWLLHQLSEGADWRMVSHEVFRGQGSLGNGAAMRVAPVGAYFADDLEEVAYQARLSAEVTHAHPEGQAGAIAVAIAAACAQGLGGVRSPEVRRRVADAALEHTPDGATRAGIQAAASLTANDPSEAASILGDGSLVRSADTVPFSLWCAWHHMDSYEAALRAALAGCDRKEADRDTICAIVGSIVVLASGLESIPALWRTSREPLEV